MNADKDQEESDKEELKEVTKRKSYFYAFSVGDGDEKKIYKPSAGKNISQEHDTYFGKLLEKLYEFNEKMNSGREISVVDFLGRLDEKQFDFAHDYTTQ